MKLVERHPQLEAVWPHVFGEPLLHPQIFDFIRQAKSRNITVSLSTNITLLDEEKGVRLMESGLDYLVLPVEMGPALLLREIMRWGSGAWMDDYSRSELIRAFFYAPRPAGKGSSPMNLIGYDYRPDEALIRQHFRIRRRRLIPNNLLKWLSPAILLACTEITDASCRS